MSGGRKSNLGLNTRIEETSRTILLGRCLFSTPVYERQTRWKRWDQANALYEQRKKLKRPFVKCFTWHDINSSYRWLDALSLNYGSLNRTVIKNCRQRYTLIRRETWRYQRQPPVHLCHSLSIFSVNCWSISAEFFGDRVIYRSGRDDDGNDPNTRTKRITFRYNRMFSMACITLQISDSYLVTARVRIKEHRGKHRVFYWEAIFELLEIRLRSIPSKQNCLSVRSSN